MNIIVGNAWPYANGKLHLGRIAVLLPGDIIARYHRMMGDNVIFISGSDAHGRPVVMKAEEEGMEPEEVFKKYHKEFIECFNKLNFSFDLFTSTERDYHKEKVKRFIEELYNKGYIYKKKAFERETGKESDHLIFSLSKFENDVKRIYIKQNGWRENALLITKRYVEEGLRDKVLTKEINWGVEVPLEGFEDKRIFVWIEALMGYLTATLKCLEDSKESIEDYWDSDESKVYLVHGKDNIPFHTTIFPGLLSALGFKGVNLSIISSEHLKLEGKDFSTNRNWAIWVDDILKRYNVDSLRYYLILNGPENSTKDFKWRNFINLNNNDLVGKLDNFYKKVIENKKFNKLNLKERNRLLNLYFSIGDKIEEGKFQSALREIFYYIDEEIEKKDYSINKIINIGNLLEPFMPEVGQKIKNTFNVKESKWSVIDIDEKSIHIKYTELFNVIDKRKAIDEIQRLKLKKE